MAKKISDEDIDEDFIIASMNMTGPSGMNKIKVTDKVATIEDTVADQESPQEQQQANNITKIEKEVRKSRSKVDYESLFIRPAIVSGRQEKTTYLREEFYNRIMKIILLYGNPRLSVFAYIDAVLEYHFEVYKQDIMDIYNKMNSAPY